jgi:hypothetical protein
MPVASIKTKPLPIKLLAVKFIRGVTPISN